jgi:hypothetical protein
MRRCVVGSSRPSFIATPNSMRHAAWVALLRFNVHRTPRCRKKDPGREALRLQHHKNDEPPLAGVNPQVLPHRFIHTHKPASVSLHLSVFTCRRLI